MRIRTGISLSAVAGILIVAVSATAFWMFTREADRLSEQRAVAEEMLRAVNEISGLTAEYVQRPGPRTSRQWKTRHQSMRTFIGSQTFDTAQQRRELDEVAAEHERMDTLFAQLAQLPAGTADVDAELRDHIVSQLRQTMHRTVSAAARLASISADLAREARRETLALVATVLVAIGLLVSIAWLMSARSITRPLDTLRRHAREIGAGSFHRRLGFTRDDEIGELAREVDDMATNLARITVTRDQLQVEVQERERAERALRESEEVTLRWLNLCTDGVWDWDLVHDTEYLSPRFKELFGYEDHELPNLPSSWQALIHPDDKQPALDLFVEHTENDVPYNIPVRYRHKDGSTVWVICRGVAIKNEDGKPVRMLGAHTDITALKRAEEQLANANAELEDKNREMERFTYTVSHDLRSPLITIQGFLGLLQRDLTANDVERIKTDSQHINTAAARMTELLDELLRLSRVGRLTGEPESIQLSELAAEAVALVSGRISQADAEVVIQQDMPAVYGEANRLREVIQNLVDNAVKYIGDEPHPKVQIGARSNGVETIVHITDNGIGIDPKYHEKIFGLFDQLDADSDGVGMGLPMVRRIVEVHGGRIWVESEGTGTGSTFYVALPRRHEGDNTTTAPTNLSFTECHDTTRGIPT